MFFLCFPQIWKCMTCYYLKEGASFVLAGLKKLHGDHRKVKNDQVSKKWINVACV